MLKNKFIDADTLVLTIMSVVIIAILAMIIAFYSRPEIKPTVKAEEFTYKGHTYIYFKDRGIAHSQECTKCYELFD